MSMTVDPFYAGGIRRIRQACANCRRKKTKCSGERPICFHCRRNRLSCVYEPYSATVNDTQPSAQASAQPSIPQTAASTGLDNTELLQRLITIESRLAELSGKSSQNNNSFSTFSFPTDSSPPPITDTDAPLFPPLPASPKTHPSIPPTLVLHSIIDTYFRHVHNQPYSYFQESSFRQRLENNSLPDCLILAILSSAVRFSNHEYFAGKKKEASEKYARDSWLSVLAEHFTVEENLNVHVVQTVNLLAVVDYTAGRVSSGWLKIGLAARISQDLHLMSEPDRWLSHIEQEERRRTFWSSYLIDKLISCGRSRPVVIHDEDCNVQLPCDEQTFNISQWRKTNTLDQLLNWNMEIAETPSPFALVILMASIFGRCTRYVHQNRKEDEIPPWDTKSEYAAINSSLLLLESYSNVSGLRISDIVQGRSPPSEAIDQQQVGHFIFAHTLFHLCHCLLNHPFLVRMRLKAFGTKAPVSFSARSLQSSCAHAKQLIDLLREATESGCLIESSFYAYCIAVAGGIHSLACHFEEQNVATQESDSVHYFQQSMDALESLADLWVHAANMFDRIREFHSMSHRFANLLDPSCLAEELDSFSQEVLWSMIDYRILGSDPHKKPLTDKSATSNMATMWALESNTLSPPNPRFDGASPDIFSALTPTMRLNEVEYLLNCSPGANGIV